MKVAIYKTEKGAARYAAKLAAIFPKRQFVPVPSRFAWSVGVYNDGVLIALAAPLKPAQSKRND